MNKRIYFLMLMIVGLIQPSLSQNNFIVCGKPNVENDIFTDIQDTLIQPGLPQSGSGATAIFNIDMDNNTIPDFRVYTAAGTSGGEWQYTCLLPLVPTNKICYFIHADSIPEDISQNPPTYFYLNYNIGTVFSFGDTIDNQYIFTNCPTYEERLFIANNATNNMDFWLNIGEKYIGISMQVNDVTLYGWILVEVTNYARVIVKEFACNKNPYIGISPNSTAKAFELYPNPAKNEVVVALNGEYAGKPAAFALYDLSGKKLFRVDEIPKNGRIALPALVKGLYVAEIEVDGQRFTRKLQIE